MSDATTTPSNTGYTPWTRAARWGLVIVVLIAAGTRLIGLGSLDVWMDEVYSHEASSDLLPKLLKWETVSNESSSPLPFIEQKFTRRIFGEESPLSLRLPSALHGIASVAFLYLIVGFTIGWSAAFWAALLLAINPFALEWSREGRMYTQWTAATLLLIAMAYEAVRWTREEVPRPLAEPRHRAWDNPIALNWRWWLTGFLFMLVHAMNVMGTMTLGGVGLWLGVMGLVELKSNARAGLRILTGAALATGVYLCSWGLTGIAKALMVSGVAKAAKDFKPPVLQEEVLKFLQQVPGHVPTTAAIALWLLVLIGLVLLVRQGRWRIALLLTLAGLAAWLGYPAVAKSHYFAPKYVYTGVLTYCVGLGALAAWLSRGGFGLPLNGGRAIAALLVITAAAIAWPFTNEVFFVPKMEIRKALHPVQTQAKTGDVFILVPDYYESLDGYKPYRFGDNVMVIRGPKEARYGAMPDEEYKGTFETRFPTADPRSPKQPPGGTWLFLLNVEGDGPVMQRWEERLASVQRVLSAYGLTVDDVKKHLTPETFTLTLRLSLNEAGKGVIEHLTPTLGRRFR
ncbi:MAG: glycosyltransferase family 39 protein [Phycisphaeraceae bacterium]